MVQNDEKLAITLLKNLVRIDTSIEGEQEYPAVHYIKEFLSQHNISSTIIKSPKNRASIMAKITTERPEKEPLVLLSHLDVVPPGNEDWENPPFSGKEDKNCIWGRGTLDTKQLVVMHLVIFLTLYKERHLLNRHVYFVSTADEETGSKEGMEYLVTIHPELFENSTVLSEGGGFTVDGIKGTPYHLFASAEKGTAYVQLEGLGESGHAGSPPQRQAIQQLNIALKSLFDSEKVTASYPVLQHFEQKLTALLQSKNRPKEVDFLPNLRDYMKYETFTVDKLSLGNQINVIPYKGKCVIEFRTLPSETKESFCRRLHQLFTGSGIKWELLTYQQGYESDPHSSIITLIKKHAPNFGFTGEWVPFTALGKTDGRFIGSIAKNIYGLSPLNIPFSAVLQRVHNIDERIEIEPFLQGVHVLKQAVYEFCQRSEVSTCLKHKKKN